MTVASSAQAVLVAIRRGVLSSMASSIACWRCPTAAAVVASRVSPASVSTSSGRRAKTSRVPTETMLTPCSGRDETVPGCAVVDDAIEALAGSLGALRRRPRQDRGAENGDLTVVVDEGGRLRRRRRRHELRQILRRDADVDDGGGDQRHAKRDRAQPGGKTRRRFAVFHNVLAIG